MIEAFKQLQDIIVDHGKSVYPNEACGFIAQGSSGLYYSPRENKSTTPKDTFEIDPQEWDPTCVAVVHSHPNTAFEPTKADMEGQINTAVPWGIYSIRQDWETKEFLTSDIMYFGKGVPIPPLVGRTFRWGPSGSDNGGDCYAIIKDFYKLKYNIDLPEFPRDNHWWKNGGDMYRDGFVQAGFRQISEHELQDGDVFLAQVLSKVPNHGGIYLSNDQDGKGMCLHHLTDQLSRRDNINVYKRFITHFLRYDGERREEGTP